MEPSTLAQLKFALFFGSSQLAGRRASTIAAKATITNTMTVTVRFNPEASCRS
jgi:hypothetical protein